MWSLGSILVEILSGFPLWLSLKSRVQSLEGRSIVNFGIFGVSGRDNNKILQKQNQLFGQGRGLAALVHLLKKGYDYTGTTMFGNREFMHLLSGMLEYNPKHRLSPADVLSSDFISTYA